MCHCYAWDSAERREHFCFFCTNVSVHPACDLGLPGHKSLSLSFSLYFRGVLRRLEDFVIYMPCIKLSTVITITICRTGSLPQIQRSVVVIYKPMPSRVCMHALL